MRLINKAGLDLITSFEGLKLKAYQDMVGVWTIGWGCTKNVHEGMIITQEEAKAMLQKELETFQAGVPHYVKVALNDNEFAALVSFSYNEGLGSLQTSTLLRLLNGEDREGAADQFLVWNKVKDGHGGYKVADGLTRRRTAERELFLTPIDGDGGTNGSGTLPDGPSDDDINTSLDDIEKEALK